MKERLGAVVFNLVSLDFLLKEWNKGISLDLQPLTFIQPNGFGSSLSIVHIELLNETSF